MEQGRCRSVRRDREDRRNRPMGKRQRNLYLYWSKAQSKKKDPKLMLFRRLPGVKKGRAVRMGMMCRCVWGIWGHLLNVSRDFRTFWNPQKNGCEA